MKLSFDQERGRRAVRSANVLVNEQDPDSEQYFDLERELSGKNLEKFKADFEKELEEVQLLNGANRFEIFGTILSRLMVISLLSPNKQTDFENLRVQAFPVVLNILDMEIPGIKSTTKETIVSKLLMSYPEHRQDILDKAGLLKKPKLEVEKAIEENSLREIDSTLFERVSLFSTELPQIKDELEPWFSKIKEVLSQDDWELTAIPVAATIACIFPDRLTELQELVMGLAKENPPSKWNNEHSQPAYVNYLYFLTLLSAASIHLLPDGTINLGKRRQHSARPQQLPPRELV